MNLKSLLLGSAATLIAFSSAHAADAVIAEPEPVEYVKICDAFGAGFFYLPGTETCLKIGGYVRYQIDYRNTDDTWKKTTKADLQVSAKSETEMGTLTAYVELFSERVTDGSASDSSKPFQIDNAYISLGGLKMGYYLNAFDGGVVGEGDSLGGVETNAIGYTFSSDGFDATVQLDHVDADDDYIPNVSANAGFSAGAVAVRLFGAYDQKAEEGTVKLRIGTDVIEGGRLEVAGAYSTGANYSVSSSDDAEWTVAMGYSQKLSDTVTVIANAQYWSDTNLAAAGEPDLWRAGAMVDWKPVKNFLVRAQVYYNDPSGNASALANESFVTARLRFQRSF